MKKIVMVFTLTFFCVNAFSQQKEVNSTQNTVNRQPTVIKTFTDVNAFVGNAQRIEAFNFAINEKDKTVKDSAGVQKFKVKRKIPHIFGSDVLKINNLITDSSKYSKIIPTCGDYPDLGLKFVNGNNSLCLLINTRKGKNAMDFCAVARFYFNDSLLFAREVLPIRIKFEELAKSLFPNDYPIRYVPIIETVVTENNVVTNVVNQTTDTTNVNLITTFLPREAIFHTVQENDKIDSICKKYTLKKNDFTALNPKIKKDKNLVKDSKILISPSNYYIVVKGVKLNDICKRHRIDIKKFMEFNPTIKTDIDLKEGIKVRIN